MGTKHIEGEMCPRPTWRGGILVFLGGAWVNAGGTKSNTHSIFEGKGTPWKFV
jgi:hypothetical protein